MKHPNCVVKWANGCEYFSRVQHKTQQRGEKYDAFTHWMSWWGRLQAAVVSSSSHWPCVSSCRNCSSNPLGTERLRPLRKCDCWADWTLHSLKYIRMWLKQQNKYFLFVCLDVRLIQERKPDLNGLDLSLGAEIRGGERNWFLAGNMCLLKTHLKK